MVMILFTEEIDMILENLKEKKSQKGFTLVELAIVMIIIGLLIGGILKGQELVANAQLTATVAQIKGIDAAVSTFRDKYAALPGDMSVPENRLRDCTTSPCNVDGDRNGRIGGTQMGTAPAITAEGSVAFTHLAAADLISGVQITNVTQAFGSSLPEAKIGGGFWLGFTATGAATGVTGMRPGHYLVFHGLPNSNVGAAAAGITATQSSQVDIKMDDGVPTSGDVQGTGTGCVSSNAYAEATTTANCSLYIRVQS